MADFVKKTWACDDTITADELNRMENGIEEALSSGGGSSDVLEVTFTWDENVGEGDWVCNHTYAEILSALQNGQKIVAYEINTEWLYQGILGSIEKLENEEIIRFLGFNTDTNGPVITHFNLSSSGNIQNGSVPIA